MHRNIGGLLDVKLSQDWGDGKKLLQSKKNLFTLLTPLELDILL
jgi:hypothetical protein